MFIDHLARIRALAVMGVAFSLLTACGGGGSNAGVGSGGTGFVSGVVTKGPLASASVSAYAIVGGQAGARIGMASTDAGGNFSLSIGTYAGPLLLQTSGGSYVDEASGNTMAMAPGDVMSAVVPALAAGSGNSGIQVTPLTAMAQAMALRMSGGMTDANIAVANSAIGQYFSVSDILHDRPMNPLVAGSGTGASQGSQNYGMALAAMSQYAQTLGLSASSAMVTAMANDASDGVFDGMAGGAAVQMAGMGGAMTMSAHAGTSGLGAAMNAFMNSTRNKSGIATPALMGRLNGASGQIMAGGQGMTGATLSGTVFNGTVSQATVMALALDNGLPAVQIAASPTDGQGRFTLMLGAYAGPVMLQVSGITYTDESTGAAITMGAGGVMSAALPAPGTGGGMAGVWVTPVTSMAQARATAMSGGMSSANITAANQAVGEYFAVSDVIHTQPMDPARSGAGVGTSQDARNYGMTLAAMSQFAQGLAGADASSVIAAMMDDAADGVMDGMMGGSQITMPMGGMMGSAIMAPTVGTSGLSAAMSTFANSAANASGVSATDMAALIQQLARSDGHF